MSGIERIHHAPVLRLRERLLPLIELTSVLDLPPQDDRTAATIIVVQSGDQPFGLVVEGVTKAEEIVVKPVSNEVQSVGVYGGATVMGDGSAALILDVAAIARRSNLASGAQVRGPGGRAKAGADDRPRLLTVAIGDRRAGLLTTDLERLEKIDPTDVELAGNDPVVQYRGRLLPLVFLAAGPRRPCALPRPGAAAGRRHLRACRGVGRHRGRRGARRRRVRPRVGRPDRRAGSRRRPGIDRRRGRGHRVAGHPQPGRPGRDRADPRLGPRPRHRHRH